MSEPHMVPTTPKTSAGLIAAGTFITLAGFASLLIGIVTTLSRTTYSTSTTATDAFTGIGGAAALLGAALLAVGLYRIAAHADRAAGITYPAAPAPAKLDGRS